MASRSSSSSTEEPLLYNGKDTTLKPARKLRDRRRLLYAISAVLVTVSLSGLLFFGRWTSTTVQESEISENLPLNPLHPLRSLNGPPTATFRENLRNDTKYITSFLSAGWTNDVMTYGNLIYLAIITDRIPIIAKFIPTHVGGDVGPISFGKVFDVPRLRQTLQRPILEWEDVKDENSGDFDEIGCWSIWQAVQYREDHPRYSFQTEGLKLDISYTAAPSAIKIIPGYEHDQHCTFWSLASLAFPEGRNANLQTPRHSPYHDRSLPPDEHLLCYDYMYYVSAYQPFEYEYDYSPAWRFVAQHMRWTPQLEALGDAYIRKTIGVADDEPTPPYIGIHIRHGDFLGWCGGVPVEDCFASIPVIARRVHEVQAELLKRKGISVSHVIMTSDEKDLSWWADVEARGWLRVDHSMTGELHGRWYPVLIDAVIQSNGEGFVGTDRSTMSIMARRRVESWRNGVTRTIKWGTPTADDH